MHRRTFAPAMFLLAATHLFAQPAPRGFYVGTIGAAPISMLIDPDEGHIGSYCYQNVGGPLAISGAIRPDGIFEWTESDDESGTRTGKFIGRTAKGGDTIRGEWRGTAGGKRAPFLAVRVGVIDSVVSRRSIGNYDGSFMAHFPRFLPRAGMPIAAVNERVRAAIETDQREMFEGMREMAGDASDTTRFTIGVEQWFGLGMFNERFVTLPGHYEYDGGAHPSYSFPNLNIRIDGAGAAVIDPMRVYRGGAASLKKVAGLLYNALKKSEYPCMESIDRSTLAHAEYTGGFLVVGKALLFRLWPGPHACGPAQDIVLPFTAIRDVIDPAGPIGPLAAPDGR